jgi:hypothetical protein
LVNRVLQTPVSSIIATRKGIRLLDAMLKWQQVDDSQVSVRYWPNQERRWEMNGETAEKTGPDKQSGTKS